MTKEIEIQLLKNGKLIYSVNGDEMEEEYISVYQDKETLFYTLSRGQGNAAEVIEKVKYEDIEKELAKIIKDKNSKTKGTF